MDMGTLKTGDTDWAVEFKDRGKYFTASAPGFPDITGFSWGELADKCKAEVSRAKIRVAVPYAYLGRSKGQTAVVRGTATSIHSRNNNIMASEGGKAVQLDYSSSRFFTPPEPADAARLIELTETITAAEKERRELMQKYVFGQGSLREQVRHETEQARIAKMEAAKD